EARYQCSLVGGFFLVFFSPCSNTPDSGTSVTGCNSEFVNLVARQLHYQGLNIIAVCLMEPGACKLSTDVKSVVEFVSGDLVNNAGWDVPIGPKDWQQIEDFKQFLDVNLIGLVDVTALPVESILGQLSVIRGHCLFKWGIEAFRCTEVCRFKEDHPKPNGVRIVDFFQRLQRLPPEC
uniref:Uncharacterized protein n=1 Tax=Electrophorus electricus TaxID=8005 RepID=A0AAY5F320_ELEEL